VTLVALACGARSPPLAPAPVVTSEVALYRDRALVRQRIELDVPAGAKTTVAARVAAGLAAEDIVVLDRGGLAVSELKVATAAAPTELALVVSAPRPGRFTVTLGYVTDRLTWDAAYTMTTTLARDRAVLRGTLTVHNTTGLALRARASIVDAELGGWRNTAAEQLAGALLGRAPRAQLAAPYDLGMVALGDETRVELLDGDPPRAMRSVLVYDPIGTRLDHPGAAPLADPALGASGAPIRLTESFEVKRRGASGLPAGPVRLVERQPDGSLAMLGESHLFDAATRVAEVDTVAVGTAAHVTGHRERRDWAKDDDQKRFSEEFLLTIDNARPNPVDVVLREHLYRGQNWTLAYQSAPAAKEGPQQISLRTQVPANGQAKVLYVVVYTW
jgi:hypothetical protein